MRYRLLPTLIACSCFVSALAQEVDFKVEPGPVKVVNGIADIRFDYTRTPGVTVQEVRFDLVGSNHTYDMSAALSEDVVARLRYDASGKVRFPLTVRYLPEDTYTGRLSLRVVDHTGNGTLMGGGSIMTKAPVKQGDYTFSYRWCSLTGGHNAMVRIQGMPDSSPRTWDFYFTQAGGNKLKLMRVRSTPKGRFWEGLATIVMDGVEPRQWHTMEITCKGNRITATVDGKHTVSYQDKDNLYKTGGVGFWLGEGSTAIDDVKLTTLEDGKVLLEDDFRGDKVKDHWRVFAGSWRVTPGGLHFPPARDLAPFKVDHGGRTFDFPHTEIRRENDANPVYVDGHRLLPMMLSFSAIHKAPTRAASYALPRRASLAGMPVLVPTMADFIKLDKDGKLDFTQFDHVMTRLVTACPDSYILPRLSLPTPPVVPRGERLEMAHGIGQPYDKDSKASAMRRFCPFSTASESYRQYVLSKIDELLEHVRRQPYGPRILGMTICGAGYEGNWGQPSGPYGSIVDISPAMRQAFGEFLREKYGDEAALRKAWNDPDASMDLPVPPNIQERTEADYLGFRHPTNPARQKVRDWKAFYGSCVSRRILLPLFDRINELAPNTFMGRFGLFVMPTSRSTFDGGVLSRGRPAWEDRASSLSSHPAIKFIVGCMTGSRRAGGESIYTNAVWESARLHGKVAMAEADIRTVQSWQSHRRNPTYYESLQVMRREFAHAIVTRRMALWYFDMQIGWFDHPAFNAEVAAQAALGRRVLEMPHRNVSETALVYASTGMAGWVGWLDKPLSPGEDVPRDTWEFTGDVVRGTFNTVTRVATARDLIRASDLLHPEVRDYKLYLFPQLFNTNKTMRRHVQDLVRTRGKTAYFAYAAGIRTEDSLGLENMRELTGIEIAVDETRAPMTCTTVEGDHPMLAGIEPGSQLGNPRAKMPRFYVTDPDAIPLARWADGKVAVAVKKVGRGTVVYSAVPVTQQWFYRNLTQLSGAHVFAEDNMWFDADNSFMVLHTGGGKQAPKAVKLPRPVSVVVDLATGKTIAENTDTFTADIPPKSTGFYYYGDQPAWVRGLSLGVISKDEPTR